MALTMVFSMKQALSTDRSGRGTGKTLLVGCVFAKKRNCLRHLDMYQLGS